MYRHRLSDAKVCPQGSYEHLGLQHFGGLSLLWTGWPCLKYRHTVSQLLSPGSKHPETLHPKPTLKGYLTKLQGLESTIGESFYNMHVPGTIGSGSKHVLDPG